MCQTGSLRRGERYDLVRGNIVTVLCSSGLAESPAVAYDVSMDTSQSEVARLHTGSILAAVTWLLVIASYVMIFGEWRIDRVALMFPLMFSVGIGLMAAITGAIFAMSKAGAIPAWQWALEASAASGAVVAFAGLLVLL